MTIGEKIKNARIALNLSQIELGEKAGLSERTIYTYEQTGTYPRQSNLKKLAEALNVSMTYLMDEDETDKQRGIGQEIFIANVKNQYGAKGAREAVDVMSRASALFAGGELSDEAKEIFFQSIMEDYLAAKAKASEKFSSRKRISRKIPKTLV